MALSRRQAAVQVAALEALWRAIGCAKHACGKRDSADGLRDFALCLDLSRIIKHYETILAALQIACSLRTRAAVLRCRRTLAGAYDTSPPRTRDQKHQQVAHYCRLSARANDHLQIANIGRPTPLDRSRPRQARRVSRRIAPLQRNAGKPGEADLKPASPGQLEGHSSYQ